MPQQRVRVSHIGVPGEVSPLKLKSYLRTALADVAERTDAEREIDEVMILVKVFIPRKLALRVDRKMLDRVFQDAANNYDQFANISLELIDGEFTPDVADRSLVQTRSELDAFEEFLDESSATGERSK